MALREIESRKLLKKREDYENEKKEEIKFYDESTNQNMDISCVCS